MAMAAFDCSINTRDQINCLLDNGVKVVGRYYTRNRKSAKILTVTEAQVLSDADIDIWTVYQNTHRQDAHFSAEIGTIEAKDALEYAMKTIKQPKGSAIYFSADYDVKKPGYAKCIVPHFTAINSVFKDAGNPYRIGIYSSGFVCKSLLDAKLVELTWLSQSTGFQGSPEFKASKRWNILQLMPKSGFCNFGDEGIDPDEINLANGNVGTFRLPAAGTEIADLKPRSGPPKPMNVWTSLDEQPTAEEVRDAVRNGAGVIDFRFGQFEKLHLPGAKPKWDESERSKAAIAIGAAKQLQCKITAYHEGAGGGPQWGEIAIDLTEAVYLDQLHDDLRGLAKLGADYFHIDNVDRLDVAGLKKVLRVAVQSGGRPIIKNCVVNWLEILTAASEADLKVLMPPYGLVENLIGNDDEDEQTAARRLAEEFAIPMYVVEFGNTKRGSKSVKEKTARAFATDNPWVSGIYYFFEEDFFESRPQHCAYIGGAGSRPAVSETRSMHEAGGGIVVAANPIFPGAPAFRGSQLVRGEHGSDDVRLLQTRLNELKFGPLVVDGDFGEGTENAVLHFQARNNSLDGKPLAIDGEVGERTWGALFGPGAVFSVENFKSDTPLRALVVDIAASQIGVTEQPNGSNRGPEIDEYLRSVKIDPTKGSYPWCIAFIHWVFDQACQIKGTPNPLPMTAGVIVHWKLGRKTDADVVLPRDASAQSLKPGMIFHYDLGNGKGHAGIVIDVVGDRIITIEGNTNPGGSREGYGVFRRDSRQIAPSVLLGYLDFCGD